MSYISEIKAPSVNMIPVDPSHRMNTVAALALWNKIIAEYRNGDIKLDQKISGYIDRNDKRVLALEEKVRMQPKFVEEGLRTLLNDPAFKTAIAANVSRVPGWGVSMGSAVKAFLEEPKVIEWHQHEDPVTKRLSGVTALVQCGEVVKTSIFSAAHVENDNDNDGITDQIVATLSTDDFDGVPATFKVWIGVANDVVATSVGEPGKPGFIPALVLPSYHRTGLSAVVIDLSPRFQSVVDETGSLNPPDIDKDGLIGLDLPQAVKDALAALKVALDAKAAKDLELATASAELDAANARKSAADQALDEQTAAIAGDKTAAEELVASAADAVTAAEGAVRDAVSRYETAGNAVTAKDAELAQAEQALQAKQTELDEAQAAGADQATLDSLSQEVATLTETRDAAQQAKADADQELQAAGEAKAQAETALQTQQQAKADADEALQQVVSVLVPLRDAVTSATEAAAAAQVTRTAAADAAETASLNAQAANVAFVDAKLAAGIGADYGV